MTAVAPEFKTPPPTRDVQPLALDRHVRHPAPHRGAGQRRHGPEGLVEAAQGQLVGELDQRGTGGGVGVLRLGVIFVS